MSALQRLWSVFKPKLDALLGRAEDPAKLMEQALLDMQQELTKAKARVAAAVADEKRLREDFERERKSATDWDERALLGVREGREDLARQALRRHSEHLQRARGLEDAWQQHQAATEQLKEGLRKLYDRVEGLRRRKNVLMARHASAEARQQIQDSMAGLHEGSAIASFERMEDKLVGMERMASAQADVLLELQGGGLEREFEALEQRSEADARLVELRARVRVEPDAGNHANADDVVVSLQDARKRR